MVMITIMITAAAAAAAATTIIVMFDFLPWQYEYGTLCRAVGA